MIELSGSSLAIVAVVAVIGLAALVVAAVLVRQVLSFGEGTERMKEIAGAVQEGAAAYLNRQFKTLSVFAVIVFFMLFLLPADSNGERIGRSIFFLVGAVFSATTGYMGMWLAVRGNVRVAARDVEALLNQSPMTALSPERLERVAPLLEQGYFPDIQDISAMAGVLFDEMERSGQVRMQTGAFVGRNGEDNPAAPRND